MTLVATLSLVTIVLLVTGWGSAAADNVASVIVANTTSKPVPVQEVNTDANRNIKVHEQGTANTREQKHRRERERQGSRARYG